MNYGYLFTEKLGTDILWAREYCLMFVCLLSTPEPDTLGSTDYSFIFRAFFTEEHSTLVMWRTGWAGNIYSAQIFGKYEINLFCVFSVCGGCVQVMCALADLNCHKIIARQQLTIIAARPRRAQHSVGANTLLWSVLSVGLESLCK